MLTISQYVNGSKTVGFSIDDGSQMKALDSPQKPWKWSRVYSSDNKNLASNRENIKYLGVCVCVRVCNTLENLTNAGVTVPHAASTQ